jgi:hypothetical protein
MLMLVPIFLLHGGPTRRTPSKYLPKGVNDNYSSHEFPVLFWHARNLFLAHLGEFAMGVYNDIIWMRVMVKQWKVMKGSFINMQIIVFKALNARRHRVGLDGYENVGMPAVHVWFGNHLHKNNEK